MSNRYAKMIASHRERVNAFPMQFAFNNEQFIEGMARLGLTPDQTDQVAGIGGGGFIHKDKVAEFGELMLSLSREQEANIAADETGDGFIFEMFHYELENHEYCITYDVGPTLDALGLDEEEVRNDERLAHGLKRAVQLARH